MEKLDTLKLIKSIKHIIDTYINTRSVEHVDRDSRITLKKIWQEGLRFALLNIACASCVKAALDSIISFFEREKKSFPELEEDETIEVIEEEVKVEEQMKKKRTSRKK